MAYAIQIRRGVKAHLPASALAGELIVTTDTHELYVGAGVGVPMVKLADGAAGQDVFFVFAQNVASAVWHVHHNLGKYPAVTVVDSSGHTVVGDVRYVSLNELRVWFSAPFAGNVYLN
jgi:hypothetical protein